MVPSFGTLALQVRGSSLRASTRSSPSGVSPDTPRTLPMDAAERPLLRELHLITVKPLMYVANVAENGFKDNPYLDVVQRAKRGLASFCHSRVQRSTSLRYFLPRARR